MVTIVFSNTIPHRFRQISNLTNDDDGRRRTLLNFFIVNPDQPIGEIVEQSNFCNLFV